MAPGGVLGTAVQGPAGVHQLRLGAEPAVCLILLRGGSQGRMQPGMAVKPDGRGTGPGWPQGQRVVTSKVSEVRG